MRSQIPHLLEGSLVVALVAAAAFASACGDDGFRQGDAGDTVADTPVSIAVQPGDSANGASVSAVEDAGDPRTAWRFDPPQLTVVAGAEIAFTNDGQEVHTATADDGSFDTGTVNAGDSVSLTFDQVGTFAYHCSLHPWMTGEIVVTPTD